MGPPPLAPLPDELVEEILLRIRPSDPATLARAAVAQKRWCRLVAGPGFRRRYCGRHGAPPMLGFFCDTRDGDGFSTSFVPTSSFRPKPRGAEHGQLRPEDARHGRVLLRFYGMFFGVVIPQFGLVVWDPITGHRVVLPRPKGFCDKWNWKATVLCAAPAGECDHRGHFTVVLIGDYPNGMLSSVYSSHSGAWSKIIFARHLNGFHLSGFGLGEYSETSSAHVDNALYCTLDKRNKILKYDLGTREFSVIEPPPLLSCEEWTSSERIQLTTMEDGQLGLAVLRKSTLYILSRDKEFGWGGHKIIDLKKCGLSVSSTNTPYLVAFAGDIGFAFLSVGNGVFSINIESSQVKKIYESSCISRIVPYINFYTPVIGVTKRKNGAGVGASSVGQPCVASRLPSQAAGVPSKDNKPRAGASRDLQSCVASSLVTQAVDTRGQSQRPVDSRRARAIRQPQPRRLFLATLPFRRPFLATLPLRREPGHSPPPQGK